MIVATIVAVYFRRQGQEWKLISGGRNLLDWLEGAVRFVLLETIFGVFVAAAIASTLASIFVAAFRLKKQGPRIIVSITFLAGLSMLVFVVGEDRYRFERETLAKLEQAPWARIVNTAKWGDMAAPRTWFDAPVGFFRVAQPEPMMGWSTDLPTLRVTTFAYKRDTSIAIAEADCRDRTAIWSRPSSNGTFVYEQAGEVALTAEEFATFCETNWTAPLEQMREAATR